MFGASPVFRLLFVQFRHKPLSEQLDPLRVHSRAALGVRYQCKSSEGEQNEETGPRVQPLHVHPGKSAFSILFFIIFEQFYCFLEHLPSVYHLPHSPEFHRRVRRWVVKLRDSFGGVHQRRGAEAAHCTDHHLRRQVDPLQRATTDENVRTLWRLDDLPICQSHRRLLWLSSRFGRFGPFSVTVGVAWLHRGARADGHCISFQSTSFNQN